MSMKLLHSKTVRYGVNGEEKATCDSTLPEELSLRK